MTPEASNRAIGQSLLRATSTAVVLKLLIINLHRLLFLALRSAFRPTPLVAGTVFCRDFFGGGLSDLRPPGRVGRPAGADLVGTCAGDGKVEIYDALRPPGTNTPSMFRGDGI